MPGSFGTLFARCEDNIIPVLKLISVIAKNSVRKDWVAEVKGFSVRLTAITKEAPF